MKPQPLTSAVHCMEEKYKGVMQSLMLQLLILCRLLLWDLFNFIIC